MLNSQDRPFESQDFSNEKEIIKSKTTVIGLSFAVFFLSALVLLLDSFYSANISEKGIDSELSAGISIFSVFLYYIVTRYLFRARTGHSLRFDNAEERLIYYYRATTLLILPTIIISGISLFIGIYGDMVFSLVNNLAILLTLLSFYPSNKNIAHHLELKSLS